MVAVTLPHEVLAALRDRHTDLGWAIVDLVEKARRARAGGDAPGSAELVPIGDGLSLIVVPIELMRTLPHVQFVPLSEDRAFLALEAGRGLADLEVAAMDRLEMRGLPSRERQALSRFHAQVRTWRRDEKLAVHLRTIILIGKRNR